METCQGGVWDVLREDETYCDFLQDDYDVTEITSKVIAGINITEHLRKLNECISLIDTEIHNQVSAHHGDLLSHATGIETLEEVLQMLQTRISSLLASLGRVKTRCGDAYTRISGQTRQLARMQETCDLVRKTARVLYLRRKLSSQLPNIGAGSEKEKVSQRTDLTNAALHLQELNTLLSGDDLRGIQVIEEDRLLLRKAWKDVETQATAILETGMATPNQSQISSALQVFSNLETLETVTQKFLSEAVSRIGKTVSDSFNLQNLINASSSGGPKAAGAPPGRAVMPTPGNVAIFRATLWSNLEKMMGAIFSEFQKVSHLQAVLEKHSKSNLDLLDASSRSASKTGSDLTLQFWTELIEVLKRNFKSASESSYMSQAFEGEFPKLLRFFNDLWHRVSKFDATVERLKPLHCGSGGKDATFSYAQTQVETKMKTETLQTFRDAYLARSLSRLLDPINLMFATSASEDDFRETPSPDEIDNVLKALQTEISVASFDEFLAQEVCGIIAKAIRNFAAKCEMIIADGDDASQVIGPANQIQLSNAKVVNSLFYFSEGLTKMLISQTGAALPSMAMQMVSEAKEDLIVLMLSGISPLLQNVEEMIEKIILTMHNEDFSSNDKNQLALKKGSAMPSSLYMRELNDFVARVSNDYLRLHDCNDLLLDRDLKRIATRTIELFVRHVSLVRPIGSGGRMRFAADFAVLEAAISPLCLDSNRGGLASLGTPYRLLRACRPLLFAEEEQIKELARADNIPLDTILQFLFGRGPAELRSPHQTMGWTESRYSTWLDEHQQQIDRLEMIRGALETYRQQCKKKKVKEYTPIYPVILDVLSQGSDLNSSYVS